jgi:putative nucleotidyltransferase with HDIG domain
MKTKGIRIPSDKECHQLISEMGMMGHIVAHSLQVCRVALFLADRPELSALNRELIRAAALLHDITKTRSFRTQEAHAETGARLLTELGYPEVGRVIGQHVRLDRYFATADPTEVEVVNYADKRVLHDRIAPLGERMGYILERYGQDPDRKRDILLLWDKTERLEARLFSGLPFAPDDLSLLLPEDSDSRTAARSPA